jgi:hypothetical protein
MSETAVSLTKMGVAMVEEAGQAVPVAQAVVVLAA